MTGKSALIQAHSTSKITKCVGLRLVQRLVYYGVSAIFLSVYIGTKPFNMFNYQFGWNWDSVIPMLTDRKLHIREKDLMDQM